VTYLFENQRICHSVGTVGIVGSKYEHCYFIHFKIFQVMPLIKFAIDKAKAENKTYLVAGNRVRLADVDNDSVAEKLFNAKVPGVSQVKIQAEELAVLPETEAEPILLSAAEPVAVAKPAAAKR
jgi:hypothetical protein